MFCAGCHHSMRFMKRIVITMGKLTNSYMHKAPRGKGTMAPKLVAKAAAPKAGGVKVPKLEKSKSLKGKPIGRRISQHKRLAMGEKI